MNKTFLIQVSHVNRDVCGFSFHSKDYIKLQLTNMTMLILLDSLLQEVGVFLCLFLLISEKANFLAAD